MQTRKERCPGVAICTVPATSICVADKDVASATKVQRAAFALDDYTNSIVFIEKTGTEITRVVRNSFFIFGSIISLPFVL